MPMQCLHYSGVNYVWQLSSLWRSWCCLLHQKEFAKLFMGNKKKIISQLLKHLFIFTLLKFSVTSMHSQLLFKFIYVCHIKMPLKCHVGQNQSTETTFSGMSGGWVGDWLDSNRNITKSVNWFWQKSKKLKRQYFLCIFDQIPL